MSLTSFLLPSAFPPAQAHEASMAVLVLREIGPGRYISNWTLPPADESLHPIFPDHCVWKSPELDCGPRGLIGKLSFTGLGSKQSVAMIRVLSRGSSPQAYTLSVANPVATVTPAGLDDMTAWIELGNTYVNLGIDHILRGVDHLLFVLGLIWIVRDPWSLVRTITAFTVAHSISLAAATFGLVGVPEKPLNACIALSIVFLGVEIIKLQRNEYGLTVRYPWMVAFAFGLLHGLGFATALTSIGIPQAVLPYALLFFNVGVEIGQLAFVFLVLALIWAHRKARAELPSWGAAIPAYAIGSVASFWFVSRLVSVFQG